DGFARDTGIAYEYPGGFTGGTAGGLHARTPCICITSIARVSAETCPSSTVTRSSRILIRARSSSKLAFICCSMFLYPACNFSRSVLSFCEISFPFFTVLTPFRLRGDRPGNTAFRWPGSFPLLCRYQWGRHDRRLLCARGRSPGRCG